MNQQKKQQKDGAGFPVTSCSDKSVLNTDTLTHSFFTQ